MTFGSKERESPLQELPEIIPPQEKTFSKDGEAVAAREEPIELISRPPKPSLIASGSQVKGGIQQDLGLRQNKGTVKVVIELHVVLHKPVVPEAKQKSKGRGGGKVGVPDTTATKPPKEQKMVNKRETTKYANNRKVYREETIIIYTTTLTYNKATQRRMK